MKLSVIITGCTGMVGEGVLLACLDHPDVEKILVVNRKPIGRSHPKLTEIILSDFFQLDQIESQLAGYNACFFCLGVSSVGMKKAVYRHITYDLTLHFAQALARQNAAIAFCYVTGAGTDSSEKGRIAWARVKGATENALIRLFRRAYMFRPGFMKPTAGQRNVNPYYKYIGWLYPVSRALFPRGVCTIEEVGLAMVNAASKGAPKAILEVKDIVALARG
jgi:uncharacterized protein YbjT (DUF2867 family)